MISTILLAIVLGVYLDQDVGSGSRRVEFGDYEACGPCCLYMACVAKGANVDFDSMLREFQLGPKGESSLAELERVARRFGLAPISARVTPRIAAALPIPFIAHMKGKAGDLDHFVLVLFVSTTDVMFIDPPRIARLETMERFNARWSGNIVAFAESRQEAELMRREIELLGHGRYIEAALSAVLVAAVFSTMVLVWPQRK